MININTTIRNQGAGSGNGSGGGGGNYNVILHRTGIEGHYLWGRYFDATQDINGDLEGVGNISMYGDINSNGSAHFDGDIEANNATFHGDVEIGGALAVDELDAKEIHSDNIYNTGVIKTSNLSAVTAYIKDMLAGNLTCDNLTVTKAAHFFKLIIDEIKSAQGLFILSPGNTDLDHVGHPSENIYRCFFKTTDPNTGERIYNMFDTYDQVVCQTFNKAQTGVTYDVSNTWYWMLCTNTGTTTTVPIVSDTVNDVLINNFDSDHDGLIGITEWNNITDIGTYLSGSGISGSFTEMAYLGSVTGLTASAFANSRLTQINVSESVKTIGNGAFANCSELTVLNLPSQLTSIGDEAFKNCSQLTELSILRGTLGNNCFSGCTSLVDLELPEGVTTITRAMFNGCDTIQNLIIPSTVTSIDVDAFKGLPDLHRVWIKPTTPPTKNNATESDTSLFDGLEFLVAVYTPDEEAYEFAWGENPSLIQSYVFPEIPTYEQATPVTMDYHFFDLDTNDKDEYSNAVPERGDSVAVLGNRYDPDRQHALMLGAYNIAWLDSEVKAPFISQYTGVDDYDLRSHRLNVISNGRNEFIGNFKVIVSGGTEDLDEYISENSGFEIETDSDAVYFLTDREGYITSLKNVKGLPTMIWVRMGQKRIPILEWDNGAYIKFNGNNNDPLRQGKEE